MSTILRSQLDNNIKTLIKLPYSFVSVTGIDAEKFLQGQLTCDLSQIDDKSFQYGTANTPKGRMYGLFKIIRIENGFLMRLEPSTLKQFYTNLSKYKVFFKCEIKETPFTCLAYSPKDKDNESFLPHKTRDLLHVDTHFLSCSSAKESLYEIWASDSSFDNLVTDNDPETWFSLETKLGIPELYSTTQDQFILQYLNLQALEAVSFKKGCYTGQEIIARMKFLGKLKKKMFLLLASSNTVTQPGADIYDEHGKKCGVVVRSHWSQATEAVTLAVLNVNYADNDDLVYLSAEKHTAFTPHDLIYDD